MKNSLAEQETQVELIKMQLKDLFRFSEDSQYISDDVVAVAREHQRYVAYSWDKTVNTKCVVLMETTLPVARTIVFLKHLLI